jgi:hypothetical protein
MQEHLVTSVKVMLERGVYCSLSWTVLTNSQMFAAVAVLLTFSRAWCLKKMNVYVNCPENYMKF